MANPKLTSFDIATTDSDGGAGRETIRGYVCGDFGVSKGKWFWAYTHLPTGARVSSLSAKCLARKAEAIELLIVAGAQGLDALPEHERWILRGAAFGQLNELVWRNGRVVPA